MIHNFQELSTELGSKDRQLAAFVDSANANFEAIANQERNLRESRAAAARHARPDARHAADRKPGRRRPRARVPEAAPRRASAGARRCARSARSTARPPPSSATSCGPFARDSRQTVRDTKEAAEDLVVATPRLTRTVGVHQLALQHARLQPQRQRGGLPVLVRMARARGRDAVGHPGRARAGAARARVHRVQGADECPAGRAATQAGAGPEDSAAQPAEAPNRSARSREARPWSRKPPAQAA